MGTMAQGTGTPTENIARFFEQLHRDPGLQGQVFGEVASTAPELLVRIAGEHGHSFSPDDLKQLLTNRAQRSVQGHVFWSMVLRVVANGDAGSPFVQIKGPSWVNQAPYRKALPSISEDPTTSLSDLFREIAFGAP